MSCILSLHRGDNIEDPYAFLGQDISKGHRVHLTSPGDFHPIRTLIAFGATSSYQIVSFCPLQHFKVFPHLSLVESDTKNRDQPSGRFYINHFFLAAKLLMTCSQDLGTGPQDADLGQ